MSSQIIATRHGDLSRLPLAVRNLLEDELRRAREKREREKVRLEAWQRYCEEQRRATASLRDIEAGIQEAEGKLAGLVASEGATASLPGSHPSRVRRRKLVENCRGNR